MKLKLNLFLVLTFSVITLAKSQELDSVSMTFENGMVRVSYDFLQGEEGEDYELFLYGSHDNFVEPLQYTTGDVGKKIQIGPGKIIYWDAKKELGVFKGDFSLKIKGNKYIPFVSYNNINAELKIKRGEIFIIKWTPSTKASNVLLKILRNDVPISDPLVIENSGEFSWEVSANLKAGKGYTVQILNTENLLKEETSDRFSVTRKIPLAYKIIPAIVLVGVSVVVLTKEEENGIPNPPGVPE